MRVACRMCVLLLLSSSAAPSNTHSLTHSLTLARSLARSLAHSLPHSLDDTYSDLCVTGLSCGRCFAPSTSSSQRMMTSASALEETGSALFFRADRTALRPALPSPFWRPSALSSSSESTTTTGCFWAPPVCAGAAHVKSTHGPPGAPSVSGALKGLRIGCAHCGHVCKPEPHDLCHGLQEHCAHCIAG
jgi:hypothetical protein